MRIISRLDGRSAGALAKALPRAWTLHNTRDLRELTRAAQSEHFDVVVLDPLDPELRDQTAAEIGINFRDIHTGLRLPVVLLTPVDVEALDAVVRIAHHVHVAVIYKLGNDRLERALTAMEEAAAAQLAVQAYHALTNTVQEPLSHRAAFVIEKLFYEPSAFRRSGRALTRLGMNGAMISAELKRAGLADFHVLRRISRVLHTYQLAVAFGTGFKDIISRVGVGSIDSLSRETRKLTGLPPAKMCAHVEPDRLLEISVRAARAQKTAGWEPRRD